MSIVLTQQAYPASTQVSSALPWLPGATSVSASAIMSNADALNAANACTFAIAASYDPQGATFQREAISQWQGGVAAPGMTWGPGTRLPTFVRVEIDLPQSLSIGADLGLQ